MSSKSQASGRSYGASRSSSSSRTQSEQSGAVSEAVFERAFEDVPPICLFSAKDVTDRLTKIRDVLSNTALDWEKRVDALRDIRALLAAGAIDYATDINQQLRGLDPGLLASAKDLRSQVVREACITVAYLSKRLEARFDFSAESILPSLISLLQSSAKIMASSASVAIFFIIKYTHAPRLIQIFTSNLTSKSNIIRSQCYEFIAMLLITWSKTMLDRHMTTLQEAIKRGQTDADAEARAQARRSFCGFAQHFPEQAAVMLNSFDAARQRQLLADIPDSSVIEGLMAKSSSRPGTLNGASKARSASAQRRTSTDEAARNEPDLIPLSARTGSQQRLQSSSLAAARHGVSSDYSARSQTLTRPTHSSTGVKSRTRPGPSQSQPGSRSNSPPRLVTRMLPPAPPDVAAIPRPSSALGSRIKQPTHRVAQSQGNSRDTSPTRQHKDVRGNIIRRASDLEAAVADAWRQRSNGQRRPSNDSFCSDNASETSSVCSSELSTSRSHSDMSEDLAEVLASCASGSWTERREGLWAFLQLLQRPERRFTKRAFPSLASRTDGCISVHHYIELKRVTDLFTRMFHDPHSKVFAVFIEAFIGLISVHGCDLVDWFQLCLIRLLNKVGMDVLSPLQGKISMALVAMRDSFPQDYQFSCLMRFVVEQAQSPNVKVKLAVLNYTLGLVSVMASDVLTNNSDTRLAVSRFITWASEPKSPDVRKAAQSVIIGLYQLNSTELSSMLSLLPKNFQEGAAKILVGVHAQPMRTRQVAQHSMPSMSRQATSTPTKAMLMKQRQPMRSKDGVDGMNNEDIFNDLRQVTADLQHLSLFGRQMDLSSASSFDFDWTSKDGSSHASTEELSMDDATVEGIFAELTSPNERLAGLGKLLTISQSDSGDDVWDRHFKSILSILLDLMKEDDGKIRATSLKVLKEILRRRANRFIPYIELTILKLLEFEKDTDKEVLRAAEDCSCVLAQVIDAEQCFEVLTAVIQTAEFPISHAAIKLEEKVIKAASEKVIRPLMSVITPALMKSFESSDNSSVRKSSMLCLVSLHEKVGDDMLPLLSSLNSSKMKLLNLYILRNQEQKAATASAATGASEPSSPASPPILFAGHR